MKIIKFIILLIVAAPLQPVYSNNTALSDNMQPIQNKDSDKWGLLPFAAPFYTPDTNWGIAVAVIYFYNPEPDAPDLKTDTIEVYGAYTRLGQICGKIHSESYYFKDRYKLLARIIGTKYPDKFFGIGPSAKDSDKEDYTPIYYEFRFAFMRETLSHLYIGPYLPLLFYRIDKSENGGLIDQGIIPGTDGTEATGIGLQIDWDRRDSPFYTRKGFQFFLRTAFFHESLGSEYNFSKSELDYRVFVQVFREHVIAFQSVVTLCSGTVPFQLMPKLGGYSMMRGYYDGRFRDKNYLAFQCEYRFSIFWRLGGVVFGSCGEVAPDLGSFQLNRVETAFGSGLRFNLKKKQNINIRVDVGFDTELNPLAYFLVTEAF